MSRARWPLCLLAFLLLPSAGAAGLAAFDAQIVPFRSLPVEWTGEMNLTHGNGIVEMERTQAPSQTILVDGADVVARVYEKVCLRRFELLDRTRGTGCVDLLPSERVFREARVALTVRSERAHWSFQPSPEAPLSVRSGVNGTLRPEHGPWNAAPWLAVSANIRALDAAAATSIWIVNTTLTITHAGEDDPASHAPRALDGSEVHRIETGTTTLGPDSLTIFRIVELRAQDTPVSLRFPKEVRFTASSASVAIVGTLRTPASAGRVVWGPMDLLEPAQELAPQGVFFVRATPAGGLRILGRTTNAPGDPTPTFAPHLTAPGTPTWRTVATVGAGMAAAVALWGLFTRIQRDELLDHERRRILLEAVRANPGTTLAEAAAVTGIPISSVRHHVRQMRRSGLVRVRTFGRRTALFEHETVTPSEEYRLFRLRSQRAQRLLQLLLERPGRTQRELAAALGSDQANVSHLVRELADLGVLRVTRSGRMCAYEVLIASLGHPRRASGTGSSDGPQGQTR